MVKVSIHVDPEVERLIDLFDGLLAGPNYQMPIKTHLGNLSERLLSGHQNKHPGIRFVTGRFFGKKSMPEVFSSDFTLDDARDCIAREFGYENWHEVNNLGQIAPDAEFESLVDSLLVGDLDLLKKAIAINPDLVHQCSSYPHKSTLLHYTGSNGVEGYRQVVPSNLVDIVDYLLFAGADSSLEAQVYGGSTAEGLMETSKHPHDAGLFKDLKEVFGRFQKT